MPKNTDLNDNTDEKIENMNDGNIISEGVKNLEDFIDN